MLVSRSESLRVKRGSVLASFNMQTLTLIFFAAILPAIAWFPLDVETYSLVPAVRNSLIGAGFTVIAGVFMLRRVAVYPGTRMFSYIFVSFSVPYAFLMAFLLSTRLDYSSVYLLFSYSMAIIVGFISSYWLDRIQIPRFYVVPFGGASQLAEVPDVDWRVLSAPVLPEDSQAAVAADLHFDLAPEWERVLAEAALRSQPVYHVKDLMESLTGRVKIGHLSENSFGSLQPNLAYGRVKRVVDIITCLIAIPVLVVPLAIIALLIKLDSPGPVFFYQERMGYRRCPFMMIKFRTMRPAPPEVHEVDRRQEAMTQHGDDRITKLGRFLRRTRLDEFPQLINVLKGEMSLVGPRPEALPLSQWYEAELPFYVYRHIVRPGITGWAQVHQGHVTDLEAVYEKLTYDFYYVKYFSGWLDALIALRTISTIYSGIGAK